MAKKKERKFSKITVDVDGEKIRRTISYRTHQEFVEKQKKVEEEIRRKFTKSFSNIADEWEEVHNKEIQHYTSDGYKAPLKDLKEEFGEMLLSDITSILFQQFLERMADRGYARHTINLRKIVMNLIFNYAIFNEIVSYNPITVCKIPKKAHTTSRSLPTDAEILKIQGNSEGFIGLYCNLLIYTGLRREEALALKYEDINYNSDTISVNKTLIFESNKPVLRSSMKSKAGLRTVPLLFPLKNLLIQRGAEKQSGFIFSVDGNLITKGQFDKAYARYKKETGISCTSHQLRHYFATLCFDANLDEKDLQKIMGHSKISLTKEIYIHIRQDRSEESKSKLNQYLANETFRHG